MKKDSIFQFIGYSTNLEPDVFVPQWELYAKGLSNKRSMPVLKQQVNGTKSRFQYISYHEWPGKDFPFSFLDHRRSEYFPEHNVKMVQAGGYVQLHAYRRNPEIENDVKLVAFMSQNEIDIEPYRCFPQYHLLNVYQAYYESCSYGYVLEFMIPEKDASELLLQLKLRPGTETGLYKECMVLHL